MRAAESYRAGREARLRWSRIAHPLGGLGSFEKLTAKLAEIYGDASLPIPEKRCAVVFCGDHGVVREGVAQAGSGVTAVLADRFARGRRYLVRAECTYSDGGFASFDCSIRDSCGTTVAKAALTAFQPGDEKMLEEMS